MANLPEIYNAAFLANHGQNNAAGYGITIKPADTLPGQPYWRVIGIHHLTGDENRGNHHVYCDVLDEQGERIKGARIGILNNNLPPAYAVIDKPDNEPGANAPMSKDDLLALYVHGEHPSEKAQGFRSTHPDEEVGNTWGHHSFYVVWQLTKAGTDPDDDPPTDEPDDDDPPVDPTPGLPGWRDKLTSFEKNLVKYYQQNPNTLETALIVKLVEVLNGRI